jgi:hypothetical protein
VTSFEFFKTAAWAFVVAAYLSASGCFIKFTQRGSLRCAFMTGASRCMFFVPIRAFFAYDHKTIPNVYLERTD